MIKRILNQLMKKNLRVHYMQIFALLSTASAGIVSLITLLVTNPSYFLTVVIFGMIIAAMILAFLAHMEI